MTEPLRVETASEHIRIVFDSLKTSRVPDCSLRIMDDTGL